MKIVLIVALSIAAVVGIVLYAKFRPIPDQLERLGPFDLVTHTHRYLTGYNEGRIRRATTESYSLRYKGKPFSFTGKAGMEGETTAQYTDVNALITFPSAEPAVVVNVSDPNNISFFYLIHEKDGAAVADYLGEGHGGVSAVWLDPPHGDSSRVTDIAVHRARMSGGRYLLLGQSVVLDVQTLETWPVREPYGAWVNEFKPPISFSPDRTSFARYGSGSDNVPLFVVFDFVGDTIYTVAVDRKQMRYADWEKIDQAWFDHYFEWRSSEGTHQRLAVRAGVDPIPYQGQLSVSDYDSSYVEYDLLPVKPEMREALVHFLVQEFQGKSLGFDQSERAVKVVIGSETVRVQLTDEQVAVYKERGEDAGIIRRIGARFDAALKSGRYDNLFLP